MVLALLGLGILGIACLCSDQASQEAREQDAAIQRFYRQYRG